MKSQNPPSQHSTELNTISNIKKRNEIFVRDDAHNSYIYLKALKRNVGEAQTRVIIPLQLDVKL